jgi:hypothetical protein
MSVKDGSIIRTQKKIDSINVSIRTKNNKNGDAKLVLQEIQLQRQLAEENFKKRESLRKAYESTDSENYPSYVFCVDEVLSKYGICVHAFLDFDQEIDVHAIEENRKKWLRATYDEGEEYFSMILRLCNHKKLRGIEETRTQVKEDIAGYLRKNLSDEQHSSLEQAEQILEGYLNSVVKSKKKKEQFNQVINICSVLVADTGLVIDKYINAKYGIQFVVNNLKRQDVTSNSLLETILQDNFGELVERWKSLNDAHASEQKFIKNAKENAITKLMELHLEQRFDSTLPYTQKGKYFKKWSALLESEQEDRIMCFSNYYVHKNLIYKKIISIDEEQIYVNALYETICDALKLKVLKGTNFRWDTKKGVISKVGGIKFLQESNQFKINIEDNLKSKRTPPKSIFCKQNESIVNDTILKCLIQGQNFNETFNAVKDNLSVNKVSTQDKNDFLSRYNVIKNIINTN